mgnify:CR=1 FL=1
MDTISQSSVRKAAAVRKGVIIAVVLAVLTLIEFVVGLVFPNPLILLTLAVLKAVIVIQFFMHVSRVFAREGGH